MEERPRFAERECSFYPEVSFQRDDSLQSVVISAPWLTLRVYVEDPPDGGSILQFDALNEFLAEYLLQYPVAFATTLYTAKEYELTDSISPTLMAERSGLFATDQLIGEVSETLLAPWDWDINEILRASFVDRDSHNCICAFTYIRRLIFRGTLLSSLLLSGAEIKSLLAGKSKRFLQFAILVLNQSFHVTSQCVPSLSHFEAKPDAYSYKLENYIKQEAGHHNLIKAALLALGAEPSENMVCEPIRDAMRLLTFAAREHPFALANCIGVFEMASFAEKDQLAELLSTAGQPAAAAPLLRHFEINKNESHATIGFDLSEALPPVPEEEVIIAARLSELLCRLLHLTANHYSRTIVTQLSSHE